MIASNHPLDSLKTLNFKHVSILVSSPMVGAFTPRAETSALRRVGIAAVAVALGDSAVQVVEAQFRALPATDLATDVDRFLLGPEIGRSPGATALFDIPAANGVVYHMMCILTIATQHIVNHELIESIKVPPLRT
jgi:hypothetical protein